MGVTTCGHQPALGVARPTTIGRSIAGCIRDRSTANGHDGQLRTRDRVQGGSVRMAPQLGVEERRDVLFFAILGSSSRTCSRKSS